MCGVAWHVAGNVTFQQEIPDNRSEPDVCGILVGLVVPEHLVKNSSGVERQLHNLAVRIMRHPRKTMWNRRDQIGLPNNFQSILKMIHYQRYVSGQPFETEPTVHQALAGARHFDQHISSRAECLQRQMMS